MSARKIGMLGGTFNPVHHGHLILAERAREALELEVLYLVPSGTPPHKAAEGLAPAADRLEMVRLATAGNPRLDVFDLEVRREGTTYTVDTLRELRADDPAVELYFLIGADSVPELPTWRNVEELFELAHFVTLRRPGYDDGLERVAGRLPEAAIEDLARHGLETPHIEISASQVRERCEAGLSIRYLVPDAVREHIEAARLYGFRRSE